MVTGTHISIITLNVNGLNAPTKRHRLAEWIQKQDLYIRCLQETYFRPRDTYRLKVRGWKNIPCKWKSKESQSSNTCIRKNRLSNKDCHKREGRTPHDDQGINPRRRCNNCKYLCTQNTGAPQYIRQMLTAIKGEFSSNTIIVGEFSTPLTPMDRSSRQKINKETQVLNNT